MLCSFTHMFYRNFPFPKAYCLQYFGILVFQFFVSFILFVTWTLFVHSSGFTFCNFLELFDFCLFEVESILLIWTDNFSLTEVHNLLGRLNSTSVVFAKICTNLKIKKLPFRWQLAGESNFPNYVLPPLK